MYYILDTQHIMSAEGKITAAIAPVINALSENLNNTIVTNRVLSSKEAMDRHEEIMAMLREIASLLKESQPKKATKAVAPKKDDTAATETPAAAPPKAAAAKFPISARAWYLQNYVSSDAFRLKYTNDILDAAAKASDTVAKKSEADKPGAIALCKWNLCQKNDDCKTLRAEIVAAYEAAKVAHKQPAVQQTAEEFDD
jgi:hypothetical protein